VSLIPRKSFTGKTGGGRGGGDLAMFPLSMVSFTQWNFFKFSNRISYEYETIFETALVYDAGAHRFPVIKEGKGSKS
jgi:hypothetical protein